MTPIFVSGNPTCASLVVGGILTGPLNGFKIDPVPDGLNQSYNYDVYDQNNQLVGTITITITALKDGESTTFNWTSTFTIDAVIVKGGPNANVYNYQPAGSTSDTSLHSPPFPNPSQIPALSHIDFCYAPNSGPGGPNFMISGTKFYDSNGNGMKDAGEPGIAGWTINLTDENFNFIASAVTDSNGNYKFQKEGTSNDPSIVIVPVLTAGTWNVYEDAAPTSGNWYQTLGGGTTVPSDPAPPPIGNGPFGAYTIVLTQINFMSTGNDFGNLKLGAGGGMTLGFWSNPNGRALFNTTVTSSTFGMKNGLAVVNSLGLVNAAGVVQTFTSHAQFRTWLLGANATNMAYMLSAQLAAMALNVHYGKVDPNALIYAPGTNSAVNGFAKVIDIINEAKAALASKKVVLAGDPLRDYYAALKDALDEANNNKNFIQPPC